MIQQHAHKQPVIGSLKDTCKIFHKAKTKARIQKHLKELITSVNLNPSR